MSTYKQHLELASERFQTAEEQYKAEKYHTAAHLFINAAINFHNALCQKFLKMAPSHKSHSDTGYFHDLADFLGQDFSGYQDSYEFLMAHKSQADYGAELSTRRCCKSELLLGQQFRLLGTTPSFASGTRRLSRLLRDKPSAG